MHVVRQSAAGVWILGANIAEVTCVMGQAGGTVSLGWAAPAQLRCLGTLVEQGTALIVDDEHNIVDLLTDLLEGELGLRVLRAYDGLAALETYARARPDLVIADIMMPRLDGLALANRLRERYAAQKIILMSAAVFPRTSDYVFIAKPFDIDRLLDVICELLELPQGPTPTQPTRSNGTEA